MIQNIALYNALVDRFKGNVAVVAEGNEGSPVVSTKGMVERVEDGEQYRVNCPVCGDTRKRLYISHYCFKSVTVDGRKVKTDHLMYCHNEKCDLSELKRELRSVITNKPDMSLDTYNAAKKEKKNIAMPKGAVPVNSPEAPLRARQYLQGRNFDLDELASKWDVRAVEVLEEYPDHGPKIIYPVYWQGSLKFWQARICFDPSRDDVHKGIRKYYISQGACKSEMVYNRMLASAHRLIVVVEGVTDVHRLGENGIALFGKVPSTRQIQIIRNSMGDCRGVIMLDQDAREEVDKFYERYETGLFDGGLVKVYLEKGDPADYSREELWEIIKQSGGDE